MMSFIYDMADTWNNGATTFVGIKLNVLDTASAAGSLLMDLQVGGSSKFSVDKSGGVVVVAGGAGTSGYYFAGDKANGLYAPNNGGFFFRVGSAAVAEARASGFGLGTSGSLSWGIFGIAPDLILARDAANTLAQRNGANAQAFRLYNTYTDASNYERASIRFTANVAILGTEAAGTGTARDVAIQTPNGSATWTFVNASKIFATPGSISIPAGFSGFTWSTQGGLYGTNADGVFVFLNAAATSFGRLNFGGSTASFPALKRATVNLEARLADDSDYAGLKGKHIAHANAVAETPTATHTIRMFDAAGTEYKILAVAA